MLLLLVLLQHLMFCSMWHFVFICSPLHVNVYNVYKKEEKQKRKEDANVYCIWYAKQLCAHVCINEKHA